MRVEKMAEGSARYTHWENLDLKKSTAIAMPKTPFTTIPFPLSGLFGIIKPSGPTSMSIVNDLQKLITRSRLFVDAEKLELLSSSRGKKKAQMRPKKGTVKVGQGGTLDPLADGVLGEWLWSYLILLVHDEHFCI